MLEAIDIQSLFSHIKLLLPESKATPRLTRELAQAWCDTFDGYSVDQLKHAANQRAKVSRYWPNITEIAAHLPPLPDRRRVSNTAIDEDWESMLELHRWWAKEKEKRNAAGIPSLPDAMVQGMTGIQWLEKLEQAEQEGRYAPVPPPGAGNGEFYAESNYPDGSADAGSGIAVYPKQYTGGDGFPGGGSGF